MKLIDLGVSAGLLAAASMPLFVAHVEAAEFNPMPGYSTTIQMTGDIELNDGTKLANVLGYRAARGLKTEFLMLNSSGGYIWAAHEMAGLIRLYGITTIVDYNATCASACMLTFAAGVQRGAWAGARLGVHNASTDGTAEDGSPSPADKGTVLLAQEMASYGAPASIITKLVITPPSDMAWLTNEDVAGWVTILEPEQPAAPQPAAQSAAPAAAQQRIASSMDMSCQGQRGVYRTWFDGSNNIQINDTVYRVVETHIAKTGAQVATGKTPYGGYSAVFGGPNPRIEFWNGKEQATDRCW
jgi:hypothetical protein